MKCPQIWELLQKHNKKAIVFDLDGTLIDSMGAWSQVDTMFFSKRNLQYDQNEYFTNIIGKSLKNAAEYTNQRYNLNENIDDILHEWNTNYEILFQKEINFFPFVEQFLLKLIELDIPFGIATAGENKLFDMFFDRYPTIKPFVKAFVTCNDVGKNKPDPDVYLECIRQLGMNKEDCIIFEDTIEGLTGVKNCGCLSILALTNQKKREQKIALADYYFESYEELI